VSGIVVGFWGFLLVLILGLVGGFIGAGVLSTMGDSPSLDACGA